MKKFLSLATVLLLVTSCRTPITPAPQPGPSPNPGPPMPISVNGPVVISHMNAMVMNPGFPTAPNTNHWVTLSFNRQPVTYTVYQRSSLLSSDSWTAVTNIDSYCVDLNPSVSTFYTASASIQPVQHVGLLWSPSPDESVIGYNVYYGVGSRSYDHVFNVGTNLITAITNLSAGTTYYFAVTAYDPLAESDFSGELAYLAPSNPGQFTVSIQAYPKIPTALTLASTNVTDTTATLQGRVVDSGRDLTATVFFYGTNDPNVDTDAEWSSFISSGISTNQVSVVLSGLIPSTKYYFSLAAINAAGMGQSPASMSFTTQASP